jgi:hypothetical protein
VFAAPASIPHIAVSNTTVVPSAHANPDAPAAATTAASIAAPCIPASDFQEPPLRGRRGTDHKALCSSSKVSFIIYHLAKHLTSSIGHGGQVLNM